MKRAPRLLGPLASAYLILTAAATAQPTDARPSRVSGAPRPSWGTNDRIQYHVAYSEFSPDSSATPYATGGPVLLGPIGRYSVGTFGFFTAQAHLPSGAVLLSFELDYCDNSAADVVLSLSDCDFMADDCNPLGQIVSSAGTSGCNFLVSDLSPLNYTVDNNNRQLLLGAFTGSGDANTVLLGAYIGYRLQVSPAPETASFGDVPTDHPYFRFIEALYASGITAGCGAGNYCPGNAITRGEMAVFLAKALGLHFPN
jgi:hypothetical protein